jgi:ribosomal protein S18 acetylase RimI-like enzyme
MSARRVALTVTNDAELYRRGAETCVASWDVYARGANAAAVHRVPGASIAVFPEGPERHVYNNTLLKGELGAGERADALDAMESAYATAGVTHFAAWVHETDEAMRRDLERRRYTVKESTRAMGMLVDNRNTPQSTSELVPAGWPEYLEFLEANEGVPTGLLAGTDPTAFYVLVARPAGENVAAAISLDFDGDCGIYNVGTLPHARRRGLGTALTALHVQRAGARGCQTATLQSTAMAARVYARVGFRDLGRILEYAR